MNNQKKTFKLEAITNTGGSVFEIISQVNLTPRFFDPDVSIKIKRKIIDEAIETLKEDLKCKLTV
jgi:hypothetical protein